MDICSIVGMNIFQAILLGLIQGLTEFLPVSSSGHLVLARSFMKIGTVPILFDVILHIATLTAVLWVFRRRIALLAAAGWRFLLRRPEQDDKPWIRLWGLLLAATAVTAVLGALSLKLNVRENPRQVAMLLIVSALILLASPLAKGSIPLTAAGWKRALIIGGAQGLGVLPGISRSGISISAGLFLGLERKAAGEFSFLLSIPAILGALVLSGKDGSELSAAVPYSTLIAGFFTALIVGYICLRILLWLVASGKLWVFALYLLPVGLWVIFWYEHGV